MKKKNPMKPIMLITLVVFVLITAIVVLNNKQSEETKEVILENQLDVTNQPTLGNPNAAVSMIEFADYKCPACKYWSETIFPQLQKDYIDTGKISFSYVNVLFHGDESFLGGLAARSIWHQDRDAFWIFTKELYKAQPAQQNHDDAWITVEKILEIAEKAVPTIDLQLLEKDILETTYKEEILADDQLVIAAGVKLTPSIVINGVMLEDPFDYEYIKEVIERGLK